MMLYGIGLKSTILKGCHPTERKLEFIVDETTKIKVGPRHIWLRVATEPKNREILAVSISKERNTFVADQFLSNIVKESGKHPAVYKNFPLLFDCMDLMFNYNKSIK